MNAQDLLNPDNPHIKQIPTLTETGTWQGEQYHITKDGREIVVNSRWTLMLKEGQPQSVRSLIFNRKI